MIGTTLQTIRTLINEAKTFVDKTPSTIHNVHTLSLAVLAQEFYNELNFLDNLLTHLPEKIPDEFKARCALRQSNTEQFISFADHPATLTNRLYYKIAILIFNPVDLSALLAILMPNTKHCFRWESPAVRIGKMSDLAGVTIHENVLEECIFFDDAVFPLPLNACKSPSLQAHLELCHALNVYPALTQKFYRHNNDYKTLATHIRQANDIAPSFREMLLTLISSLRAGGEGITGSMYANTSASLALGQFSEYFATLPQPIQKVFKQLPTKNHVLRTFGELFDAIGNNDLPNAATCIETSADNLEYALKLNNGNDIFDYRPTIAQETLDYLNNYYEKLTLSCLRGCETLVVLPFTLLTNAFKKLTIDSGEVLLLTLKDLPPETYLALLENVQLPVIAATRDRVFISLTEYCRDGLLNEEQRVGLLNALVEQRQINCPETFLRPLKTFLFNSLPIHLCFSMLMNNPSKATSDTFCDLFMTKKYRSSAELQTELASHLPLIIRLTGNITDVHTQIKILIRLLERLPPSDQISCLALTLFSDQRVIDFLLKSSKDVLRSLETSFEGYYNMPLRNTLIWLLRLLTDENITHVDELTNAVLGAPNFESIKSTLATLLKIDGLKSRYFVSPFGNYQSLFTFYANFEITITDKDCYHAIVSTTTLEPSFKNINFIETLLKIYFELNREALKKPFAEEMQTLLNCALTQSCLPTPNGGTVFNPVLLLLFDSKIKKHRVKKHFSELPVIQDGSINRAMTVGELIQEARSQHNPHLDALEPSTIKRLIKSYFNTLEFASENASSAPELRAYFEKKCRKYTPHERLFLFNYQPQGDAGTLNALFGEYIRPVMSELLGSLKFHSRGSLTELEEYFQYAQFDWLLLLKSFFEIGNTVLILHLLKTRLSEIQQLHCEHHLVSLYFDTTENISATILVELQLCGFTLADVPSPVPQSTLNACLNKIIKQLSRIGQSQVRRDLTKKILVLIDMLVKAGADVNNTNFKNMPPLFHTRSITIMRKLLALGADINFITSSGRTILSYFTELLGYIDYKRDYKVIMFLLRHQLSPDIINHQKQLQNKPITLLSAMLEDNDTSPEAQKCLKAALKAGANPLFWNVDGFCYAKLLKRFPRNTALLSWHSQYIKLAADKPTFELIYKNISDAIKAYSQHMSSTYNASTKGHFLAYDIANKTSHLQNLANLLRCAFSIDEIHTALRALITTFVDSNVEGIITVKRQPDLQAHKILFHLIRTVYGEAQLPQMPPQRVETRTFNHYFVGKVPQSLLTENGINEFLIGLHPDQFCTFNVFELLFNYRNHLIPATTFDALTDDQMFALIDQFFIDACQRNANALDCITILATRLQQSTHLVDFYNRLFHFGYTDQPHMVLMVAYNRIPQNHRSIFISVIPTDTCFRMFLSMPSKPDSTSSVFFDALYHSVFGRLSETKFFRHQADYECIVKLPQYQVTVENFRDWEARIHELTKDATLNSRGDTVFHHLARNMLAHESATLFHKVKVPTILNRITILLMKNCDGESVLSLLKQRVGNNIQSTLILLFQNGSNASVSLSYEFTQEICLHYPEFFFPIFFINDERPSEQSKFERLHVHCRGVSLLERALQFTYENKQTSVLQSFSEYHQNYFKTLTNQPPRSNPHALFSAPQNREHLNTTPPPTENPSNPSNLTI